LSVSLARLRASITGKGQPISFHAAAVACQSPELWSLALEILKRLGAGPAVERLSHAMAACGSRTYEPADGRAALMTHGFVNAEISARLLSRPKQSTTTFSPFSKKLDAHTRGKAVFIALHSSLSNQNREPQTLK